MTDDRPEPATDDAWAGVQFFVPADGPSHFTGPLDLAGRMTLENLNEVLRIEWEGRNRLYGSASPRPPQTVSIEALFASIDFQVPSNRLKDLHRLAKTALLERIIALADTADVDALDKLAGVYLQIPSPDEDANDD